MSSEQIHFGEESPFEEKATTGQELSVGDVLGLAEEREAGPTVTVDAPTLDVTETMARLVEVIAEASPHDALKIRMGPGEQVATVPVATLVTQLVRVTSPAILENQLRGWATRWGTHWCERGSHVSFAKPCPKHEV